MTEPNGYAASARRLIACVTLCIVAGACTGTSSTLPTTPAPTPSATETPHATTAVAATPVVTATPAATPLRSLEPPVGSWTLATILPGFDAADLVVASGDPIAVGCRMPIGGADCAGAEVRVSDGGGWVPARLDGDGTNVRLAAIAVGPAGFVAVGRADGSDGGATIAGAAFVSRDGRTWSRAPDQASLRGRTMVDVAARPDGGWVAVGSQAGPTHFHGFETWSSPDGVTWTRVGSVPDVGPARGVTTWAGGLVAWGSDCLDVCGPPGRAAIWTSRDGTAWVRAPKQPALAGGWVDAVIPTASGTLALGTTYDAKGVGVGTAWTSKDGAAWTRTALPEGAGHQSFRLASAGDDHLAIGARYDGNDTSWGTWTSTAGAAWARLEGPQPDLATATVAVAGNVLLAIGRTSEPSAGDSAVWLLLLD